MGLTPGRVRWPRRLWLAAGSPDQAEEQRTIPPDAARPCAPHCPELTTTPRLLVREDTRRFQRFLRLLEVCTTAPCDTAPPPIATPPQIPVAPQPQTVPLVPTAQKLGATHIGEPLIGIDAGANQQYEVAVGR